MKRREIDVLVVGAGPAGAAAGRVAARAGLSVVMIEKGKWPRYKTCGGGLLGRAAAEIAAAGVNLETVEERRFCRLEMNLLDSGQKFAAEREWPIVRMTMRAELDGALVAAAEKAGAEFISECAVKGMTQERAGVCVRAGGKTPREFLARYVIGADGANSATARLAGWAGQTFLAPALEWEVKVSAEQLARHGAAARFDFDLPGDGYAWVFPKRGHLSVGVVSVRRRCADLNGACAEYMRRIGVEAIGVERHGFVIPTRVRAEDLRGRVLLAGDAAGLADPITLEGISHALVSGRLAAEAIVEGGDSAEKVRRRFGAVMEEEILAELRRARMVARVLYGNARVRAAMFKMQGRKFVEVMTEIASGRRRYREVMGKAGSYLKLLKL